MLEKQLTSVTVTCSRNNHNEVWIRIRDEGAVEAGFELRFTLEEFASLVTGMVVDQIPIEITNPDKFGKVRVTSQRETFCPLKPLNKDELRQWLLDNRQEEGWEIDAYLGSQGSVTHCESGCILRYRVKKWVDND